VGDLLSAASLLLAVVAVLYGLWYPEIMAALEVVVPQHIEDRVGPRRRVSRALVDRAVPLLLGSVLLAAVFLPDVVTIVLISVRNFQIEGCSALRRYDAVRTSFCLVVTLALSLAAQFVWLVVRLLKLLKRFSAP
jgi:hypothetical protein